MRRRSACWVAVLVMAAGCPRPESTIDATRGPRGAATPGAANTAVHREAGPSGLALPAKLTEAASHPELGDLALYLRLRTAAAANDAGETATLTRDLLERFPDSIWSGRAQLDLGRVRRRTGDRRGAHDSFAAAVTKLPAGDREALIATLSEAEIDSELGDGDEALDLAEDLRDAKPRGLIVPRLRRLRERIMRGAGEQLDPEARLDEADLRLGEGDARGAQRDALSVLDSEPSRETRDRAIWIQARAERALGHQEAAEALCLALASSDIGSYSARALGQAAHWRWNADDDAAALKLFRDLAHRFPNSSEAPEALYAMGRIQQEAGSYDDAYASYTALAERYPSARVAGEARWRSGWVRYLAGDYQAAAKVFGRLAGETERETRVAAEYWEARALDNVGAPEAQAKLAHLAQEHGETFYGVLASARLGLAAPPPDTSGLEARLPPFPETLTGPHADRARRYATLGLHRLAQRELDTLAPSAPTAALLQAYAAVDAPGPALRLARGSAGTERRYLYPLGYWEVVRPFAEARGLDPLLVAALIRQESLFVPDAVSPADAHGLMQLLPSTARDLAAASGTPPPDREALHQVAVNVDLGTSLLRRLLDRYGGSRVKALAAYNAGEDAVGRWEKRYGGRPDDEFVELISYRETREYVKAVIQHYEIYRQLYAPSASATSFGNPPKEPLDMMTMTSPDRAEASR
jgi:soluble lytic murein transglycosylase